MRLRARIERRLSAAGTRLGHEGGFTMVAVTGYMMVGMLFAIVAISAATGDLPAGRADQDRKRAYAAAEAGLNDYFLHLSQDSDYWTKCTGVVDPSAVNQRLADGTAAGPTTMKTRPVPGTTDASYGIELIPASGQSECSAGAAAQTSMIEPATGTFRIRSTGIVRGKKRSIVATFRRRGFLDFIYFTDFETSNPALVRTSYPTRNPRFEDWYASNCATNYWWGATGRAGQRYLGEVFYNGVWSPYEAGCSNAISSNDITFGTNDKVLGPFHTNDTILTCGAPQFGRPTLPAGAKDAVEVSGPGPGSSDPGWRRSGAGGCDSGSPVFNTEAGTLQTNAGRLELPPSNVALRTVAQTSGTLLTGRSTIELGATSMTVNGVTTALPANGVIYVQNQAGAACGAYDRVQRYAYSGNPGTGCGDVFVKGTYSRDLTINAQNDIVVYGDTRRATSAQGALLGLIAENFVRVYHPVNYDLSGCPNSSTTTWGSSPLDVTIDAAVLALKNSFLVDNWSCGAARGTLTVNGAIAQKYRGPVAIGGSSISSGYVKNYQYNDQLRYRSPPRFLDPVQASWRIVRNTEQVPAK